MEVDQTSQTLIKTGLLTEKINNRQHNDGKVTSPGSLLGVPMELSNGLLFKKHQNNNQTYIYKGFWGIRTSCLGGPAQGTEPEQLSTVWYVGIQVELILDCKFRITT